MTYVYIQVYQETRRLSKYEDPDQTYQLASISCLHPEQKQEYQSQRESRYDYYREGTLGCLRVRPPHTRVREGTSPLSLPPLGLGMNKYVF